MYSTTATLFAIVSFAIQCYAGLVLPTRDGPASMTGGVRYQAIRFEPLCGTWGDTGYGTVIDYGGAVCVLAMRSYQPSPDKVAMYDLNGIRLKNAIIGYGAPELCLCFSLQNAARDMSGDMCIYFNEYGQVEQDNYGYWTGSVRPNGGKELHQCADVDVDALTASWRGTAVYPNATEVTRDAGPTMPTVYETTTETKTETTISATTLSPSAAVITLTRTSVSRGPDGQNATKVTEVVTTAPVVYLSGEGSTSRSDRIIALGVGLALGILFGLTAIAIFSTGAILAKGFITSKISAGVKGAPYSGLIIEGKMPHSLCYWK